MRRGGAKSSPSVLLMGCICSWAPEIRGEPEAAAGEDLETGPRGPLPEGRSGNPRLDQSLDSCEHQDLRGCAQAQTAGAHPPSLSDSGAWVGLRMDIPTDSCLSKDRPPRRPTAHPLSSQTVLLGGCSESCHPCVLGCLHPHHAAAEVVNCAPGWLLEIKPQTPASGTPSPQLCNGDTDYRPIPCGPNTVNICPASP